MVKLQKRFAYTYKDKDHYKHVVTIPEEVVERLGWKEGQELEPLVEKDTLMIRRAQKNAKHK